MRLNAFSDKMDPKLSNNTEEVSSLVSIVLGFNHQSSSKLASVNLIFFN